MCTCAGAPVHRRKSKASYPLESQHVNDSAQLVSLPPLWGREDQAPATQPLPLLRAILLAPRPYSLKFCSAAMRILRPPVSTGDT